MFGFIDRFILKLRKKEVQGPKTKMQLWIEADELAKVKLANGEYDVATRDLTRYAKIFDNLNLRLARVYHVKPAMLSTFNPKSDTRYFYYHIADRGMIEIGLEFNRAFIIEHKMFMREVSRSINMPIPNDMDHHIFTFLHEWAHHLQYMSRQYSHDNEKYISDSGEVFDRTWAMWPWLHPHLPWEKDANLFALTHYLYFKKEGLIP
jgi:hypothetical protein